MPSQPKNKRITVDIPADLYDRLVALAADERRDLKPQVVLVLERACKMHEGRKQAAGRRSAFRRILYNGD